MKSKSVKKAVKCAAYKVGQVVKNVAGAKRTITKVVGKHITYSMLKGKNKFGGKCTAEVMRRWQTRVA